MRPTNVLFSALILFLLVVPGTARAGGVDAHGYVMIEHERDLDIDSVALGNVQHDGRYTTKSIALFTASDGFVVWSGAEFATGISLARMISPTANFGVILGSPDDATDGTSGTFAGMEAYMEWGVTLRLGPLYGFAGRRNYYGHNGIERGERSDVATFGLRMDAY
ncbi:MAG: hypothetical protein OEY97_11945 [Nitrospirota bacterium]|nr:hypothetical protein [Nitrospirota bacterium]